MYRTAKKRRRKSSINFEPCITCAAFLDLVEESSRHNQLELSEGAAQPSTSAQAYEHKYRCGIVSRHHCLAHWPESGCGLSKRLQANFQMAAHWGHTSPAKKNPISDVLEQ